MDVTHSARPLTGKVALVTGAGRRVGQAIALELARAGAHLAIHHGESVAGAEKTRLEAESLGVSATCFQADLADASCLPAMVHAIDAAFGRLDLVVNCAAIFGRVALAEISLELWDRMHAINLRAPFVISQAAVPVMRRGGGGQIINIADVGGLVAWPYYSHYVSAKAGLVMLTKSLALELAPDIRVNAVAPGTVLWSDHATAEEKQKVTSRIPLGRIGKATDIARSVCFLATGPDFITGQILAVDGGRSIQMGGV